MVRQEGLESPTPALDLSIPTMLISRADELIE
jgi:hypothetical protein